MQYYPHKFPCLILPGLATGDDVPTFLIEIPKQTMATTMHSNIREIQDESTYHDNSGDNGGNSVSNQELDAMKKMIRDIRRNPNLLYLVFDILQEEQIQISEQEGPCELVH